MSLLPPSIRAALTTLTAGRRIAPLQQQYGAVSDHYRAGGGSAGVIDSEDAVATYVLARLPATYAACRAALAELATALPEFAPNSALDVGCGPGAALLAALETYPGIRKAAGLDCNARFLRFASRLFGEAGLLKQRDVFFQSADLAAGLPDQNADITLASYTLVEMTEAEAITLVGRLWSSTSGALVLVEPGSRAGFSRIRAARSALIEAGAHILAPCTHAGRCAMPEADWCHFSKRLPRSREHQAVKGANVPFEDEKFSYLVAARHGMPAFEGRIVAPVHHSKAGHRLRLCDAAGLKDTTIGTRDPRFKPARKWQWGDGI